MDSEQRIFVEFYSGDLKYLDAIERLTKIYDDAKEAERVVSEWAEAAEIDNGQFGVGA
jgi:hypothetical protein